VTIGTGQVTVWLESRLVHVEHSLAQTEYRKTFLWTLWSRNISNNKAIVFVDITSLTGGQPNFARSLAVSWADTLYIHFWGLLPPNGILPPAKFTLRPSFAFSYIGSVTAWHSSSGRQLNLVAWYKEWNYGTFAEGATYIRLDGHHFKIKLIWDKHVAVFQCYDKCRYRIKSFMSTFFYKHIRYSWRLH